MKTSELIEKIQSRINRPDWIFRYHQKEETLRIEESVTNRGVTIELSPLLSKVERKKDEAIDEVVYYIKQALTTMEREQTTKDLEKSIFPVIRSTSFPTKTDELELLFDDHTGETRIYYALDLENTYRLLDQSFLNEHGWTKEKVREVSMFNLRRLSYPMKSDSVAGNTFYFIHTNDGYDASRILNTSIIKEMNQKVEGTLAISIPHQDVCIFADIKNDQGYDILAQMTFQFFTSGRVPITALPFLYENETLQPIFILAKKK